MPPPGASAATKKQTMKKATKPQNQDEDGSGNIRWTKALELALAGRMVDEYNSKYVANKASTSKRWAADIGILDADPRGKKTKHHITKMVLDWKKTWDWSQGTGRGDIEKDGVIVGLEQQCIDKCHYFKALLPVFGNSSSVQPSAQLTSTGNISTASVGVSRLANGVQRPVAEAEEEADADADADDDDEQNEDEDDEGGVAEWRDSDDEDDASKDGDEDENVDLLNRPQKVPLKAPVRQATPLSRGGSATPRQPIYSVTTPSNSSMHLRQGKKMSAIDEMRAMIQAPVEAQKAKYQAKVAIAKSELDKERAQKEHEIKMTRLSILQKEQERSHEIAVLNAKAEIDHYNAEIERLKLKRSMGLDLTDEEKEFICKPAPKMLVIAAPKSILDDPDLAIISSRSAPEPSQAIPALKQGRERPLRENEPERKATKRKLGPDVTPSTTINLESTRTPTTTQRGQINDLTPTVKRPSKKPKPSTDVPEKQSISDTTPVPTPSSTAAASDACTSPVMESVVARIQRASVTTTKIADKLTNTTASKAPRAQTESQPASQLPPAAGVPQTSQPHPPNQRGPYDPNYPDDFYRSLHMDEDSLYHEGYSRMMQGGPHLMNEAWQAQDMYRAYGPGGPSQMPRFYGEEQSSTDDQAIHHQRGFFFNGHPGRFPGPRPPHPRHHGPNSHPMYPHPYAYPHHPQAMQPFGEVGQAAAPVSRPDHESTSPDTVITAPSDTGANAALEEPSDT